jgi:hypothetical protein
MKSNAIDTLTEEANEAAEGSSNPEAISRTLNATTYRL